MMKVTVRFGKTRVIVPCGGDGELYIRDLIAAAIVRYKKATNKVSLLLEMILVYPSMAVSAMRRSGLTLLIMQRFT
jgi:hypothetical protein